MLSMILAAAPEIASLGPSDKWVVDHAPHQCVAVREFGPEDKRVTLIVKPSPTSDVMQLMVMKKGSKGSAVQHLARVSIGTSEPITVRQLTYGLKGRAFRLVNLDSEQARTLAGADAIAWNGEGARFRLATGKLEKLMKALADCRADLRDFWNIDSKQATKLKSPAMPERPLMGYFKSGNYPLQAVLQRESGTTSVVALIDEKGTVRDCMIDGTSGIATLDAMTCIVVRERVRFTPAIGEDGVPVRSYFMQRVRWEMPQR